MNKKEERLQIKVVHRVRRRTKKKNNNNNNNKIIKK